MSFQDEIRQSLRTKQELEREEADRRMVKMQENAQKTMERIRWRLKNNAQKADYEIRDGKVYLQCRVALPSQCYYSERTQLEPLYKINWYGKRTLRRFGGQGWKFHLSHPYVDDFIVMLEEYADGDGITIDGVELWNRRRNETTGFPFSFTDADYNWADWEVCIVCSMTV